MSLYADYLREWSFDEIIEDETGFATYRFPDALTCYIVNIYIKPEYRRKGCASQLADQIVEIAKLKGCVKLIGSVVPSARASTQSIQVLIGYGMKLDSSAIDFILFSKEIS